MRFVDPRDPDTWTDEDSLCLWKDEGRDPEMDEQIKDVERDRLANEKIRNSLAYRILRSYLPSRKEVKLREKWMLVEWNAPVQWPRDKPVFIDFDSINGGSLGEASRWYGQAIANQLYCNFRFIRFASESNIIDVDDHIMHHDANLEEPGFISSAPSAELKITFHLGAALRALTLAPSFPRSCLA